MSEYYRASEPDPNIAVRVKVPAVFLIIAGLVNLIVSVMFLNFFIEMSRMSDAEFDAVLEKGIADAERQGRNVREQLRESGMTVEEFGDHLQAMTGPMTVFFGVVAFASLISVVGGWQMFRLRSRGLAITGAVLAAIPFISPLGCCLIGEIVGIWSIVVLLNRDVTDAFAGQSGGPVPPAGGGLFGPNA